MIDAMKTFLYFAYGSNMHTRRLQQRTPSACKAGTGFVTGRRLAFHKVSHDGSGKCDIEATTSATEKVYGVLFTIARSEKAALDRVEGLGIGYDEAIFTVHKTDGTEVKALAYIATATDPAMRPYEWYKALVVAGAIEHGLPQEHIERIRAFRAQPDPNEHRRAEHERLLIQNTQGLD